jgi:hypothetical protein
MELGKEGTMKPHSDLAALILAAALAGPLQAFASEDQTDAPRKPEASAPAPLLPDPQQPAVETAAPARIPPQAQAPVQPVVIENLLGQMMIYPAF